MAKKTDLTHILQEQLELAGAAAAVLQESFTRATAVFDQKEEVLSIEQRETLEALTARFSRLSDFLTQRLFRTIDEMEMAADGSLIDRINRAEKRGILPSAEKWREIRDLRNEIAHEYLIEKSDSVVRETLKRAPELFEALARAKDYCLEKFKVKA